MIPEKSDLTALRLALGWTQSEAARHCGVSQPAISAAERGRAPQRQIKDLQDLLVLALARKKEEAAERDAARQMEALAAAMPDSAEWQALRHAIKERALDYLDRGCPEACDALLEMIPDPEVAHLLTEHLEGPLMTSGTPAAPDDLAGRIDAFIERYAKIRAGYDPLIEQPDERFNGPDTAMLSSAADAIRGGRTPAPVHSSWALSGCYRIPRDAAEQTSAQAEHDELVSRVNALAHGTKTARETQSA